MILIAEMKNGGVFEADSKKKLTDQMIRHFAENDCDAGQIKALYIIKKDDRTNEFCNDVVTKIQSIIDKGIAEWRKIADEEYRGQQEIESEIKGMIY
jgi:hypothetical protein